MTFMHQAKQGKITSCFSIILSYYSSLFNAKIFILVLSGRSVAKQKDLQSWWWDWVRVAWVWPPAIFSHFCINLEGRRRRRRRWRWRRWWRQWWRWWFWGRFILLSLSVRLSVYQSVPDSDIASTWEESFLQFNHLSGSRMDFSLSWRVHKRPNIKRSNPSFFIGL